MELKSPSIQEHSPRLTVLEVAYPLAPVGPDALGGAEQMVSLIDDGLVRRGHRSIVVAQEGSICRGTLIATPAIKEGRALDGAARARAREAQRRAIDEACQRYPVDLVHFHGVDFHHYLPESGPPALVTLHLPFASYEAGALDPARPDVFFHCVSASQRRTAPGTAYLLDDVPNGVRIERQRFSAHKRGFCLALGRICPEKGYARALLAASRARTPLLLAGRVSSYEDHLRHFREVIEPLLATPSRARFLGPIGGGRKRRLLAAARCLLVPSRCEETSSLVVMEALASGTPVIAFRVGALPELIEHGHTGFLVDDVEGMAEAILAADTLDPRACRRAAELHFSSDRVVTGYLAAFDRVVRAARCASLLDSVFSALATPGAGA
jgi:glycosyltransferase involved in cell wall biosynthesis